MAPFRILDVFPLLLPWVIAIFTAVARTQEHSLLERRTVDLTVPLRDFQVFQPVITPAGSANPYGCIYTKVLMQHEFAYSYGMPFVGRPKARIKRGSIMSWLTL